MDYTTSERLKEELPGWLEPLGACLAVLAAVILPQALELWCPALHDALGLLAIATFFGGFTWFLTRG